MRDGYLLSAFSVVTGIFRKRYGHPSFVRHWFFGVSILICFPVKGDLIPVRLVVLLVVMNNILPMFAVGPSSAFSRPAFVGISFCCGLMWWYGHIA